MFLIWFLLLVSGLKNQFYAEFLALKFLPFRAAAGQYRICAQWLISLPSCLVWFVICNIIYYCWLDLPFLYVFLWIALCMLQVITTTTTSIPTTPRMPRITPNISWCGTRCSGRWPMCASCRSSRGSDEIPWDRLDLSPACVLFWKWLVKQKVNAGTAICCIYF